MRTCLFYILINLVVWNLQAQTAAGIRVQVVDQEGRPLAGEAVSIQNSDYYLPDKEGTFTLTADKLRVPVRAEFRNEQLEVLEIAYFEEEGKLEVKARRLYHPDDILTVTLRQEEGALAEDLRVYLGGSLYIVKPGQAVSLAVPVRYHSSIVEVKGFEVVEESLNRNLHVLEVLLRPLQNQPSESADTVMMSYEADFDRITRELEKERSIYEEKNLEIQQEILRIRDNLVKEEEINDEQRVKLKRYLKNMEKVLQDNSEAIKKTEARTKEAIAKLRLIIMEKDSLHLVAQGKIQQMEQEQAATEERYEQRILIFSSIIVALLLLALVIYFFAVKFRKQKSWLKEVNRRLKNMQQELTQSLHELNIRKAQIEEHNSQLELFVYKASHDIKGPLRSIIGLTQIGIQDVKDSTAQEYFGHINKSTQRLDNLLADLLRLTKAKQAEVEKEVLNLPLMVDDIIQSFENIKYFDEVEISVNIQEDMLFMSDEKMVYSVVQNFIENGIKYCDPRKEQPFLNITIKQETGKTIFLFEDNGLGVDPEHLPKIFDMFYKIDPASDGTGLGLHIVKVTIEKLGGTIKVNSRMGVGSLFTITFYE